MMLQIQNLSKTFDSDNGRCIRALNSFNLEVSNGELVAIMGENGSGKTTCLRILSGQIKQDDGQVLLNGKSINFDNGDYNNIIAHVPQDPQTLAFPNMTLEEHFLLAEMSGKTSRFWRRGITRSRREIYRQLIDQYHLDPLCNALSRPLRTLSGGWQQIFIVVLAAAKQSLAGDSKGSGQLLLLDEPTSALDLENTRICLDLVNTLHKEGRTVILATHNTALALNISQRVCIIKEGQLIADLSAKECQEMKIEGVNRILSGVDHCLPPIQEK